MTYSNCVFVALVIQHKMHMLHIILSSVSSMALPRFSTLSHRRHDFLEKNVTEHKMCIFLFPTTVSKTFLIISRSQ